MDLTVENRINLLKSAIRMKSRQWKSIHAEYKSSFLINEAADVLKEPFT